MHPKSAKYYTIQDCLYASEQALGTQRFLVTIFASLRLQQSPVTYDVSKNQIMQCVIVITMPLCVSGQEKVLGMAGRGEV